MLLSQEDQNRFREWIEKKCGALRCTCCGRGQWEIAPFASILLAVDTHTTRFFYHQGIPLVSLTCKDCGHMVFFSANIVGFLADQPPLAALDADPKTGQGTP
jgi:hypothetical protein